MTTPFVAPTRQETSSVKPADLKGHLLIISPIEYKTGITTSLGEAEAIEVNIVDLDTNQEHTSVLFFNVGLRNALRGNIGKQVLARVSQGAAKPGKSAPWILENAADKAEDIAKASAYLASKAAPAPTPAASPSVATQGSSTQLTPEIQALLAQLGAKPV